MNNERPSFLGMPAETAQPDELEEPKQPCPGCSRPVDVAADKCTCGQKIAWGNYTLGDPERPGCEQYIHCAGLFVDGETLAVTRCDACDRFEHDPAAASFTNNLIDLVRRVGHQMYRLASKEQKEALTVEAVMAELVRRAGVEDEPEHLLAPKDFEHRSTRVQRALGTTP